MTLGSVGQRARVGEVELAYEIAGDGSPVVWCHGLASCRDGDRDVIDSLATRFTVLAYDARGHGDSSPVRDETAFTYGALAADLAALLDHVGWDRAVLAGSSMGAGAAARVALDEPRRAVALFMVRPGSAGGPAPDWVQRLFATGAEALRSGGLDGAIEFLRSIPMVRAEIEANPERLHQLRAEWGRHDAASIVAALRGIPTSGPLLNARDPRAMRVPTFVVPGDDLIHPVEAGRAVAALIPGAECAEPLRGVPRAEETRLLTDMLADFVARVASAGGV